MPNTQHIKRWSELCPPAEHGLPVLNLGRMSVAWDEMAAHIERLESKIDRLWDICLKQSAEELKPILEEEANRATPETNPAQPK